MHDVSQNFLFPSARGLLCALRTDITMHWYILSVSTIRRFTVTDGSFSPPPVMTSSAELRAQRSSPSGGSNGAAAGQPIDFNPPTADWQYGLDHVFNIPIRRTHRGAGNPPRSFTPNTPPRRCKPVAGDGNCLFRALSYWICGSEDYHLQVCNGFVKWGWISTYFAKTVCLSKMTKNILQAYFTQFLLRKSAY